MAWHRAVQWMRQHVHHQGIHESPLRSLYTEVYRVISNRGGMYTVATEMITIAIPKEQKHCN
eukprot:6239127-Amphidinium_carterae.1